MRERTGYAALTEKEKETLRLVVRGHDAKSTARHLGLSVHTINERLRDARRKLSVSSSREAARLLLAHEGGTPESLGDNQIGEAGRQRSLGDVGRSEPMPWPVRKKGAVIMSLALSLAALAALPQFVTIAAGGTSLVEAVNAATASSAQSWLALVDQGKWQESWAATAASFRSLITSAVWSSVSERVRTPLGAVRSRVLLSQESVPAPPDGIEVLKFRTSFANRPNAVETLSLAQEDGAWRVVGYYID